MEQTIEQKAKAYDNIIERLKDFQFEYRFSSFSDTIEERFPEIKKGGSQDIVRKLIKLFKGVDLDDHILDGYKLDKDEIIAWLEEQEEHANFREKIQIGDKVTKNKDGVIVNLSQLGRVAIHTERNDDGDKPLFVKFKPGDWITNGLYFIRVESVDGEKYRFDNGPILSISYADKYFRLFNIDDAKEGDVLATRDGTTILIYKGFSFEEDGIERFASYCYLTNGTLSTQEDYCWVCGGFVPATKIQRNTLFTKLAEVGLEWDSEILSLKKIGQDLKFKVNDID